MEIALVKDGNIQVADHTYFLGHRIRLTRSVIEELGLTECNLWLDHDPLTQKLERCEPYLANGWVNLVHVVALTESEIAQNKAVAMEQLRIERTKRLAASDWTQLPDGQRRLGPTKSAEWEAYRQALADLPEITQDARLPINWPEPP